MITTIMHHEEYRLHFQLKSKLWCVFLKKWEPIFGTKQRLVLDTRDAVNIAVSETDYHWKEHVI